VIVGSRIRFAAAGRALRHRNFRLFFFGQLISVSGTWMQALAQGWLMGTLVGWDKAVVYIGLLGVVQFLPVMILGLFGGIIADVWPKRKTVVATQSAAGILALALGLLNFTNTVAVWHIFALALLLGVINAVDMPARQAFVVEMVGQDDMANAIALNSAVFNGARIVGPAIGGLLIGLLGTSLCFIFNGLSYAAVVIGLLMMRDSELLHVDRLALPRSVAAVRSNLAEGLRYVWQTPLVLLAISVIFFISLFGMNFNVILPVLAAEVLKVGSGGYGVLYAAMGAGALTSALVVATFRRPKISVLVGGGMILGFAEFVLAGTTSFPIAVLATFVCGVGAIATAASANALVQIAVPGALRGRVMAVYSTVFAGSSPIGNGLTGAIGGVAGTAAALFLGGAVTVAAELGAAVAVWRGRITVSASGGPPAGSGPYPAPRDDSGAVSAG
jgi:MFS family permease